MAQEARKVIMKKLKLGIYFLVAFVVFCAGASIVKAGTNDQEPQNSSANQKSFVSIILEKDNNFSLRFSAIEMLRANIHNEGQIDEKVKSALINVLQNSKEVYQIRIVAALTLMEHGNEKIFEALKNQAKHEKHRTFRSVLNGIVDKMENEKMFARN